MMVKLTVFRSYSDRHFFKNCINVLLKDLILVLIRKMVKNNYFCVLKAACIFLIQDFISKYAKVNCLFIDILCCFLPIKSKLKFKTYLYSNF